MTLDYKHANQILRIKDKNSLWLGDCTAAQDIQWIRCNNVRMIITAAVGFSIKYDASVRHYTYALQDSKTENIQQYFDEIANKIDKGLQWGSVLVHCGAGVSRSATLVIAYLIKYHKMSFRTALKHTKSKRPQICPNLGFQLKLKKYATPKLLNSLNVINANLSVVTSTTQNFYNLVKRQSKVITSMNKDQIKNNKNNNQSFPQIIANMLKKQHKNKQTDIQIQQKLQTQPKGWRITSSYKNKQNIVDNNTDIKKQTQSYIKNIAKFRFGMTNASKWGIY